MGVDAISAEDAWAVGSYKVAGVRHALAEHWDGSSSTITPDDPAATGPGFGAVAAAATDDVYAVGTQTGPSFLDTLIEHWDGTSWTRQATPSIPDQLHLGGVAVIDPSNVVAVGYTYGPDYGPLVEIWNGSTWTRVPAENPGLFGFLYAVTAIPGTTEAWAVGNREESGHPDRPLVERSC